jgi:nucleoporin POM152
MDIGVNAVFEFTGTPPFRVHWTEQRKGSRLVEQSRKFDAHHGEVILQPEHEGQYTYVSLFNHISQYRADT